MYEHFLTLSITTIVWFTKSNNNNIGIVWFYKYRLIKYIKTEILCAVRVLILPKKIVKLDGFTGNVNIRIGTTNIEYQVNLENHQIGYEKKGRKDEPKQNFEFRNYPEFWT